MKRAVEECIRFKAGRYKQTWPRKVGRVGCWLSTRASHDLGLNVVWFMLWCFAVFYDVSYVRIDKLNLGNIPCAYYSVREWNSYIHRISLISEYHILGIWVFRSVRISKRIKEILLILSGFLILGILVYFPDKMVSDIKSLTVTNDKFTVH